MISHILADNNLFARPSLTKTGTPPRYKLPPTTFSGRSTITSAPESGVNAGPSLPRPTLETQPSPEPITPLRPSHTIMQTNIERTVVSPRKQPLGIPPADHPQAVSVFTQRESEDIPPPYEPHVLPGKSIECICFENSTQHHPLELINRHDPSSQPIHSIGFNNVTIGSSELNNEGRRMHEHRGNAEAQRRSLENENIKRQLSRSSRIWKCIICCLPTQRKQPKTGPRKWRLILAGLCLLTAIITITILVVKSTKEELKTTPESTIRPSPIMLELPGLPPLPTGLGVVQPALTPMKGTSCYRLPSLWSCNLPPPSQSHIPNFLLEIKHRKSDPYGQGAESLWRSSPSKLPSLIDLQVMGIRDNITGKKEGEETEFTISLINEPDKSTVSATNPQGIANSHPVKRSLEQSSVKRQANSVADPSRDQPNVLPTVMRNQPLRLYDRGLESEHYATYIYFNKHIYLNSLNDSKPATTNTEAIGTEAELACALRSTRFKMQIWTRKNEYVIVDQDQNRMGIDPDYGRTIRNDIAIIPYPVTVIEDRNGGPDDEAGRTTGCWLIVDDQDNPGRKKLGDSFVMFEKGSEGLQKEDRGCFCEWRNWRERGR